MIGNLFVRNWKCHEEFSHKFQDGINFIVGPNGSGKTAILDAISFALLGDLTASPIYKNLTFRDLILDRSVDMEMELLFDLGSTPKYSVRRTFSAATQRKQAELRADGELITRRWDEVTDRILELFEASEVFFRRTITLSEGDTFDYSIEPPGEGLTTHLERVLGIDRMEGMRESLDAIRLRNSREARDRRDKLSDAGRLNEEEEAELSGLKVQQKRATARRIELRLASQQQEDGLKGLRMEVTQAEQRISDVSSLLEKLTEQYGIAPRDSHTLDAIDQAHQKLVLEKEGVTELRDAVKSSVTWLEAQIDSQTQIVELVADLEPDRDEVVCPVCRRPLTRKMISEIQARSQDQISAIRARLEEEQSKIPGIEEKLDDANRRLEALLTLESRARQLLDDEPKTLSIKDLKTLLDEYSAKERSIRSEIEQLAELSKENDSLISSIDQQIGQIQVGLGKKGRRELINSAATATKSQYLAELFLDALNGSLADQRTSMLSPLTENLSANWSEFLGVDVNVQLSDDAQLAVLGPNTSEPWKFPQLSGGEKTALLIFTHILLSTYFSNADFVMLDEPLEHLDYRNRWALMRYLVDTAKSGRPRQMIVTTVEESLIREYIEDAEVSISVFSSSGKSRAVSPV